MRSTPSLLKSLVFLAVAFLSLPACLALLNTDKVQCQTDADCTSRGEAFAGLTCDLGTNLCSTPVAVVDGGNDANPDTGAPKCKVNTDCPKNSKGSDQICVLPADPSSGGTCVPLVTDECPYLLGDIGKLSRNDLVVYGGFANINASTPFNDPVIASYRLALTEFSNAAGLPPGGGGSPNRRPIQMVLCNADPSLIETGIDHLINLEVPGIVSYFSPSNLSTYFPKLRDAHIFVVNPGGATAALVNATDTNSLIWHLLGPPSDLSPAYPLTLKHLEPFYRAQYSIAGATPIRVMVITANTQQDLAVGANFINDLKFNGDMTAASQDGTNYKSITVASLEANGAAVYDNDISTVLTFKPNIIIALTTGEYESKIMPGIEAVWDTDPRTAGTPHPSVIMGQRNATQPYIDFIQTATLTQAEKKARTKRFVGVQFAAAKDRTQYNLYLNRIHSNTDLQDVKGIEYTENYYDAMYWLAYGTAESGPAALTGDNIASSVRKMLSGQTQVLTGDPATYFTTLSQGGNVSFLGASGPPDFDSPRGYRHSVGSLFCFGFNSASDTAYLVYDTFRYNPDTQALDANSPNEFCFKYPDDTTPF